MPAQTTAKIVIASAKRLIELRQLCLNKSRIAEISVPAWPMPIHQTKLMIAKPQATGCVMPQMPTPSRKSQVSATISIVASAPPTPKMANHPSGVSGVSTMRAIFSVTDRKVCPGAMTRYSPVAGSIFGLSFNSPCHPGSANLLKIHFFTHSLLHCFPSTLHRHDAPPARLQVREFGFNTAATYFVRGRVFRSASTW